MVNQLFILLQTVQTSVQENVVDTAAVAANVASAEKISILSLITKGGFVMYPLLLLFVGALYLFIERLLTIRKASKMDKNFMEQIQNYVESGKIEAARDFCKSKDTPVSRVLEKGLRKLGKPIDDIEKALETAGKLEVYKLENNLSILSSIAAIAPMFGFVGTIFGVIIIFHNIEVANNIEIGVVAGGLYQKMITSASGLVVGITAYIFYHYLLLKIDKEIYKIEANAIAFIDLLQEPTE